MAWEQLTQRLASLPLVLAGPIVRHVSQQSATVWFALKSPAQVTLKIFTSATNTSPVLEGVRATVPVGDNLHIVCVTASQQTPTLQWGTQYFYNVEFDGANVSGDLFTNGVIVNVADTATAAAEARKLITYVNPADSSATTQLPSFVLPPDDLNQLRILHGSCRKPHGEGTDAIQAIDMMIESTIGTSHQRPHQVFMTGDQIYAEDVADVLLRMLTDAGETLVGGEEKLPDIDKFPHELAPGTREDIAEDNAGFTAGSLSRSHVLSIGEYCAMYLFAWSEVLWDDDLPSFEQTYPGKSRTVIIPDFGPFSTEEADHYDKEKPRIELFRKTIGNARRALANIISYMILDDHEITDDWYLNGQWVVDVGSKPLGRATLINGLIAYVLFQDWGNKPADYDASQNPKPGGAKLLEFLETDGGVKRSRASQFSSMLRLPIITQDTLQWHHDVQDAIHFHYHYVFANYELIALDTRTWRDVGNNSNREPAKLISDEGLDAQIPPAIASNVEVTLVLSAAPMVATPFLNFVKRTVGLFRQWGKTKADYEEWHFSQHGLQSILSRLIQRGAITQNRRLARLVVLSGDIHYGYAVRKTFWATQPYLAQSPQNTHAVVANFTASAFKNEDSDTRLIGWLGYGSLGRALLGKLTGIELSVNEHQEHYAGYNQQKATELGFLNFSNLRAYISFKINDDVVVDFSDEAEDGNYPVDVLPDWVFRIDMLGVTTEYTPNNTGTTVPAPPPPGNRDIAVGQYLHLANEDEAEDYYSDNETKAVIGYNNVGEISFEVQKSNGTITSINVIQELWWSLRDANDTDKYLPQFPIYKCVVSLNYDDAKYPKPQNTGQ